MSSIPEQSMLAGKTAADVALQSVDAISSLDAIVARHALALLAGFARQACACAL